MQKQKREADTFRDEIIEAAEEVADNIVEIWEGYDIDRHYMRRLIEAVMAYRKATGAKGE